MELGASRLCFEYGNKFGRSLPVGAMIETTKDHLGVLIEDDADRNVHIDDLASISYPFKENDPFRLVKSALIVTGILGHKILSKSGLNIRTWANVPRGSGLGASSILAAAVVKGIFQLTEDNESDDNVGRAVLVVEQIMGTGGGWQDQIGGLYPGINYTQSFPGQPLRLQVVPLLASPQLQKGIRTTSPGCVHRPSKAFTPSPAESCYPITSAVIAS